MSRKLMVNGRQYVMVFVDSETDGIWIIVVGIMFQ
jgi:hypothetical protein